MILFPLNYFYFHSKIRISKLINSFIALIEKMYQILEKNKYIFFISLFRWGDAGLKFKLIAFGLKFLMKSHNFM